MATLYENSTWTWAGQIRNIYGNNWYVQTFTPSTQHNISSVILALGRSGSPGTVTVSIRATSAGKPTGGDLCSGTTDGDTLPAVGWPTPAPEEREITFSTNLTLSASTMYAIVVRATSGDSSNKAQWSASTSSVYADGTEVYSTNGGSSWTVSATRELWFKEYGDPYPGKARIPTPADDAEDVYIVGIDKLKYLQWQPPAGETPEYKVYFRVAGESWTHLEDTGILQVHTITDALRATFDYYTTYEWRVDTYDPDTGVTTTGDTWTYITLRSHHFTTYIEPRIYNYDPDKPWEPGTGWVDIDSFEYTGGGRFKRRLLVVGHKVIYFGDL